MGQIQNKLLVVDDDQLIRTIYEKFFSYVFDVKTASNGQEAIELLKNEEVDAIITDINMPIMDGLELSRNTRKMDNRNSNVVIVAISASNKNELPELARDCGINKLFEKPAKLPEVQRYISLFLDNCT